MASYNVCPDCGANLDIGEKCDCQHRESNLISVKQIPIIEQQLKQVAYKIQTQVNQAQSLVVTADNKQVAKKIRTAMNADFKELEELRKQVKQTVLAPYNDFETLYKEMVTDKYKTGLSVLDNKIFEIESAEIQDKWVQAKEYFDEYLQSLELDISDDLTFERINLKVNLTTTLAGLKKQITEYLDRIYQEYTAIAPMENSAEIYIEYLQSFNFAQAVGVVNERYRLIKERQEIVKPAPPQPVIENQHLQAPIVEEKVLTLAFKVTAPISKLKALKQFLNDGGYQYE